MLEFKDDERSVGTCDIKWSILVVETKLAPAEFELVEIELIELLFEDPKKLVATSRTFSGESSVPEPPCDLFSSVLNLSSCPLGFVSISMIKSFDTPYVNCLILRVTSTIHYSY